MKVKCNSFIQRHRVDFRVEEQVLTIFHTVLSDWYISLTARVVSAGVGAAPRVGVTLEDEFI